MRNKHRRPGNTPPRSGEKRYLVERVNSNTSRVYFKDTGATVFTFEGEEAQAEAEHLAADLNAKDMK